MRNLLLALLLAGCASSTSRDRDLGGNGTGGDLGDRDAGQNIDPSGGPLVGVWKLSGTDARGAYTGQLELRATSAIRIVEYTDAKVEDGHALWWVWTGATTVSSGGASVVVSLRRADFVKSRGGVTRTDADRTPLAVTGAIALASGGATAHWTGAGIDHTDTLTDRADLGATPIFVASRTSTPAHDAPSASSKQTFFSIYASYQALPEVMPYAAQASFQAGVLDVITDETDLAFYRAHPDALRVVDKVIDAPSLGETLSRANAFSRTLAGKAALLDTDTPVKFLDPLTGQLGEGRIGGVLQPSFSSALWTSAYVASQAYRFLVTGEAAARDNVARSIDSILLLMEVVPDQTQFARAVRPASGAATGEWHAGTGAFAAYDWLQGGNNDMFKGLFYGTLTAHLVLCDPIIAGKEALCARLKTGIAHLQDLSEGGGTTETNHLIAKWLNAYANNDSGDLTDAATSWFILKSLIEQANLPVKELATADWSGTHLSLVQHMSMYLLADKKPVPGLDAKASVKKGITYMRDRFQPFRMGLWSVIFAQLANAPSAVDAEHARARLREFAVPKVQLDVDHRVGDGFVMSPYPELPWKNDWTTTDRTASLHGYPLYEMPLDVYVWRVSPFGYKRSTEGTEQSAADYLHAYWLARYLGVVTAAD